MTDLRSTDLTTASATCFNLLGNLPAGAAALMMGVSAAAMISGTAQANCFPDPATPGADNITCDAVDDGALGLNNSPYSALGGADTVNIIDGVYADTISGGGGDDTLTLDGTADVGAIDGDTGNDTINLLAGTVGTVTGQQDNDTITLDGATVTGNILGGTGDDAIALTSGTVAAVSGDAGDDMITLGGAAVTGDISGSIGNDTITLISGSAVNVGGGGDDDTIILNGAVLGGDILADSGVGFGFAGDDTIDLLSGSALNVDGEGGNDTISLDGAAISGQIRGDLGDDAITLSSGTANSVEAGAGDDTIILNGAMIADFIDADNGIDSGHDTILLLSGAVGDDVFGGFGNDTITLSGAVVSDVIFAGQGEDTVELLSGSARAVDAREGEDMITLNGASITDGIFGGADDDVIFLLSGTATDVTGNSGNDLIILNGASLTGEIDGNINNDNIFLLSGSVDTVTGGTDGDVITLDGASVSNRIDGELGEDFIFLQSGTAGEVFGGSNDDTITLLGASVTGDINAGAFDDTVSLLSGVVGGNVLGGQGIDSISLDGAVVVGNIDGGLDNDRISLNSGTVTDVFGSNGLDNITLNGAMVSNSIDGGTSDDVIDLLAGTVVNVFGGTRDDSITLDGATVTGDIDGGSGDDEIELLSGTVGGSVLGGTDDDDITIAGATVSGDLAGGTEDDQINLFGGTVMGNLDGGADDDTIFLLSGSVSGDVLGGGGSDVALVGFFGVEFDLSTLSGVIDGGDDAEVFDGQIDLLFIGSNGTLTGEQVLNWEGILVAEVTLTLEGNGLTTSVEDSIFTGLHLMDATVDLDDGFAIIGDVTVDETSTLITATPGGTGVFSISDDLRNSGTVDMTGTSPAEGDLLTVSGDYTSNSDLLLDVALDATEAGDSLVIAGDILGAPTEITFTDTNPFGPPSFTGTGPGNGIVVVDNSAGGFIVDGDFIFDPVAHPTNEILKVPFVYMLSLESDDILYLQSDVLAQVYGYAILAELMREDFPILRERLGDKRYNGFSGDGTDNDGAAGGGVGWDNGGIWARIEGTKRTNEHRGDFTTGEWEASRIEAEVGIDIPMNVGGGQGLFGISTHFIQGFADANSGLTPDPDVAEVDTTGFGAGLSFVYFPGGGFYADVQGRFTAWDADVEVDNRSIDQDINALGWGTSLEVGNRIAFGNTAVTPRGRAIYSDVSFESFTDDDGVKVKQEDSASVVVEGGVTVEQMFPDNGVTIFADASVSHDVLRDSAIDASGFTFDSGLVDTWGTVAIGGSMETGQGTSAFIAAEVSSPFGTTFGNSIGYGLRAGVRVDF